MARRKSQPLTPWQELEEQAYHAYREWPLFLKLRLRHLRAHLPREWFERKVDRTPASESSGTPTPEQLAADIALLKEYGLLVPEGAGHG